MSRSVEETCSLLLDNGASAATLYALANGCRERAKTDRPVLTWLGLDSLFRSLGQRIDDRAVPATETDGLTDQLRPLVQTIARSSPDPGMIEAHVSGLRDLL